VCQTLGISAHPVTGREDSKSANQKYSKQQAASSKQQAASSKHNIQTYHQQNARNACKSYALHISASQPQ